MPVVVRPSASEASWLERLPKIELHLHLEGAIPLDALWELVIKYGGDPDVPSLATLADRFAYRDEGRLRSYFDRGMLVSVNTDDPKMFGNSLADEYAALLHHHGFTRLEIRDLLDRTIRSAWLETEERDDLRRELMADQAWRTA